MGKAKASGGRTFSRTCLVKGRESEGRKAILKESKHNTRIAPIGPDGRTGDDSEKVPTEDLLDIQAVEAPESTPTGPVFTMMGKKGTLTLPSEVRRRYDLGEGSPLMIEELEDAIVLRPAEIKPRGRKADPMPEDVRGEI